ITTRGPPQSLCPLGFWGVAAKRVLTKLTRPPSPIPAMHVRDLVELAARIAVSSSDLPPAHDPRGRGIQTYWSAARCRADRWIRAIRLQGELILRGELTSREAWKNFQPLFQEILAAE